MKDLKSVPEKLRLKENHPSKIKFEKLCDLADELGISIYSDSSLYFSDKDKPDITFHIEDIESTSWEKSCREFPPTFEVHLTFHNPEYSALQNEIWAKKQEEKRQQEEALRLKREQEAIEMEKKRLKQIEAKERKLLQDLKAKYENEV